MLTTSKKSSTWKSGFCNDGQCEGTRPKSPSGKPMKTCPRVFHDASILYNDKGKILGRKDAECACTCHTMLDQMFELVEMERILQDNPEYHPEPRTYWMPSLEERVASSIAAAATPTRYIESEVPDVLPPTVVRTFTPTPTGRSARGELESYVKKVCDIWLIEQDHPVCSPAYLSEQVAKIAGWGKPPSQGAVNAVLERWTALGFAETAKKPTRFLRYTEDGVRLGLDALKLRHRDQKVRNQASSLRGVR